MRKCFPYLWFLLPRPLKKAEGGDSEIRKVVEVLGELLDDSKTCAFNVRRSWVTSTSWGAGLDAIGLGRNIRRHQGESDADYQARLLNAYELYRAGGTVPGMMLAMELIGWPGAAVEELRIQYRHDGVIRHDGTVRYGSAYLWAQFNVRISLPAELTAPQIATILGTINDWKPAHTMLAYLVLEPALADDCQPSEHLDVAIVKSVAQDEFYSWPAAMHNGVYRHDGTIRYDGAIDTLDVEVLPA